MCMTPSAPYDKSKSLGSGGSMVARLKLKGIDGSAEFVAVGKNKKKRKPIITFTGKKDKNYPRYIAHRETKSETGLVISSLLWNVIEYTNSMNSLHALTSGNITD